MSGLPAFWMRERRNSTHLRIFGRSLIVARGTSGTLRTLNAYGRKGYLHCVGATAWNRRGAEPQGT